MGKPRRRVVGRRFQTNWKMVLRLTAFFVTFRAVEMEPYERLLTFGRNGNPILNASKMMNFGRRKCRFHSKKLKVRSRCPVLSCHPSYSICCSPSPVENGVEFEPRRLEVALCFSVLQAFGTWQWSPPSADSNFHER